MQAKNKEFYKNERKKWEKTDQQKRKEKIWLPTICRREKRPSCGIKINMKTKKIRKEKIKQ